MDPIETTDEALRSCDLAEVEADSLIEDADERGTRIKLQTQRLRAFLLTLE